MRSGFSGENLRKRINKRIYYSAAKQIKETNYFNLWHLNISIHIIPTVLYELLRCWQGECHSRLPWVGFCHFCGHVTTRAILLYSPCAFKCQIYLLLNTEFTELISFILNREAIQFGKWTFVDICKRFEEHIRHWTFIFFAENHSHRLYVNKERVDCEFSLCASDCATVLYFCGPWPYGLWTFGDICE